MGRLSTTECTYLPTYLTYPTYRWRVKQGEEKNEAQAKNVAMHLCVCLTTLI